METAALLAVLVEAKGHERVNDLVEQGHELLALLVREARDEVLALALLGLGALDGVVVGHDDDLAHVGLRRLDAGNEVLLLGLGHHGVELAKAHAEKLGHLLLLHLGLELQELERADQRAGLVALLLLLAALDGAAAAKQAGGLVGLIEEGVIRILRGNVLGLVGSLGGVDVIGLGLVEKLVVGLEDLLVSVDRGLDLVV